MVVLEARGASVACHTSHCGVSFVQCSRYLREMQCTLHSINYSSPCSELRAGKVERAIRSDISGVLPFELLLGCDQSLGSDVVSTLNQVVRDKKHAYSCFNHLRGFLSARKHSCFRARKSINPFPTPGNFAAAPFRRGAA